jgi:hypothetical protein
MAAPPASLYAAFPPVEARRLADRLELHYTPKHGSWLNMAEIELAMLAGQCSLAGGEGRLPGAAQRRFQVDVQLVDGESVPEQVVVGQRHRDLAGGWASEVVE